VPYTFKHGDQPLEGVTVQRAVGRGGFGEVYYALTDSGKQVALKYLRENADVELRGIGHVMNLKSPHLVTIYDVKKDANDEPFVIMEYVSGPSLRDMLVAESGGMSVQKAAYLFKGIAQGLAHLHERGIVHRDLKPANIFYDDGYIKIGDYGLSKHISVSKHSGQTVSVGTVHYMAPEIGSGSYTKAIDIYALGIILYEMLTGRLPYTGGSMAEILMRHVRDNPDLSGVPQPFGEIIGKALAKDPEERYQDANEMLDAVMATGELEQQAKSFDATALTNVPRTEVSDAATRTTPPVPPIPNMDARDAVRGVGEWGAAVSDRVQKRLDRLGQKLETKARQVERKHGLGPGGRYTAPARRHEYDPERPRVHRLPQIIILGVVTWMVSVMLGFLQGREFEGHVVTFALFIAGGTVGPLAAYLWLLHYSPTRSTAVDRLVLGAAGAAAMLPAALLAEEEMRVSDLSTLIFPLAAVVVIFDWSRRIEAGRRGQVDIGEAFWPGLLAFIIGMIVDCDAYAFTGGILAATMSMLVQAAAAMWPAPIKPRPHTGLPGPGPVAVPPHAHAGGHPQHAGQHPAPSADAPTTPASDQAGGTSDSANAANPANAGSGYQVMRVAQPSFVGRAANAGMAGLGKVLFLAGVALAFGQGVLVHAASEAISSGRWRVDPDFIPLLTSGLPMGFIFLPIIIGILLMVASRRSGGTWHVMRGVLGGGLVFFASILGLTASQPAIVAFFTKTSLDHVDEGAVVLFFVMLLPALVSGMVLLAIPAKNQPRTIVV
jgi:hypothetical protein